MHISLKGFTWIPLLMFEKRCVRHHVRVLCHGQKVAQPLPVVVCAEPVGPAPPSLHPFPSPLSPKFCHGRTFIFRSTRRRARHRFCTKSLGRDVCIFLGVQRSKDALYFTQNSVVKSKQCFQGAAAISYLQI